MSENMMAGADALTRVIRVLEDVRANLRSVEWYVSHRDDITLWIREQAAEIATEAGTNRETLAEAAFIALSHSARVPDSGADPETDCRAYASGLRLVGAVAWVNETCRGLEAARYVLDLFADCEGEGTE